MSTETNIVCNKTVNQHYVPRCYLKNFATVVGKDKSEKVFIGFYQFDKKLICNDVPTKTICYEKYFYGEDCKIENEFAEKEKIWAIKLNKICQCDSWELDKDDIKHIKNFAIYQYGRTLATFNYQKDAMSEMLATHISNITSSLDENLIRQITNDKINSEITPQDVITVLDEMLGIIDDLTLTIIKFNTKEKLITSDMPVIIMNPFCQSKAGMANVGVMIFFPVSSDKLVVISDKKIYNLDNFVKSSNEKDVENLNKYQVISAEERILSVDTEELKKYVQCLELMDDRGQYREKRKVQSGYDGKGTFFATKLRTLKYNYELSFCKLPRYLRKIPVDCRDVFERTYSKEARLNLLISVYRIPQLLRKDHNFSAEEISKRKDGYSKMQKFMDDYWEIASEERVISPELMQKLRTVPVHFFSIDKQ